MSILFSILIIVVCLLLSVVVLMQNAKGGLNEGMGSVTQVAGVRASNEIEKITWGLLIVLVVLCIGSTISVSSGTATEVQTQESEVQKYIDENDVVAPNVQNLPSPSASQVEPSSEPAPAE